MIKAMGEAQRYVFRMVLRGRLPALVAILLAASGVASSQQKRNGQLRQPVKNVQFVTGHSALNIPFELIANVIMLKVRVNNSTPLRFIFDTGAGGSLVSARRAAGLNLKKIDTVKATGVGGNRDGYLAGGVSLSVPGVKVLNQRVAVMPLEFPFCEAKDLEGIIGYDFIKEFVVEINYDTLMISLHDPASYGYTGRGDVFPLIIKGTPRVRARVAMPGKPSIEGLFEIDTGFDGVLTINSPFVKRRQLLRELTAQVANNDRGLGGESDRFDARLGYLQLGSFRFDKPIVGFSTAGEGEGSMAVEDNDGPIGNEILRRFKVTIDYSRQRMMLEPNAHFSEPFESNMSGIEIESEGKDCRVFKVVGITEKSPAAEAGIVTGDEIVAIDGKPANQFTSAQIERLWILDGAERSLTLRRNGKEQVVKIKLRRRI